MTSIVSETPLNIPQYQERPIKKQKTIDRFEICYSSKVK